MSTVVYNGFENLEGREYNGLTVGRLVSRRPVRWQLTCTRCGTSWNEAHERVHYVTCRNSSCGRTSVPRAVLAGTGQAIPATRSRDSASAREFRRQPQAPPVRWAAPTADTFANADPDVLRRHLDYLEGR